MSYESKVDDARSRKKTKYHDLVVAGRAAGYRVRLITLEVGSRGMLGDTIVNDLREAIYAPRREFTALCDQIIKATILGSYSIWASRNHAS